LLYQLQQIDSELADVREAHGDLPASVAGLRARKDEIDARIASAEVALSEVRAKRAGSAGETDDLKARIAKYRAQQLSIKTNREYDALVREIEHADRRVSEIASRLKPFDEQEERLTIELNNARPDQETIAGELELNEMELAEVMKTTEDEENELIGRRNGILKKLKDADVQMYERIRVAKDGVAVVRIRREACTGCSSMVPHQKLVESRRFDSFLTCEHCGRILVPDEALQ
jgi:hypothetical protein